MLMNTVLVVGAVTTLLTALHESAAVSQSPIRSRWRKKHLTYVVLNSPPNIGMLQMRRAVRDSLNQWTSVSSLTFSEVFSPNADIRIAMQPSIHNDRFILDREGILSAHAFYPPQGDIHLNANSHFRLPNDRWTPGDHDLYDVLTHEIGHALGLDHNPEPGTQMHAFEFKRRHITPGDIMSIQRAYVHLPETAALTDRLMKRFRFTAFT